jgi:hypothetical protein
MEAFESVVAVALEAEGYVVSGPFRFKLKGANEPKAKGEQNSPLEIDLVAARGDSIIFATVKSFFGSGGVWAREVTGVGGKVKGYTMLNDVEKRTKLFQVAAEKFGYDISQVEVRLYAGNFTGTNEAQVRAWAETQILGGKPLQVWNSADLIQVVEAIAVDSAYQNNAVVALIKAQAVAKALQAKQDKAKKTDSNVPERKATSKEIMSLEEAKTLFPIGSPVVSNSDGFSGVVIGYTKQQSAQPYITVYNRETDVSKRRSAQSLQQR